MAQVPRSGPKQSLHVRLPIGLHSRLAELALEQDVSLNLLLAALLAGATNYDLSDDTEVVAKPRTGPQTKIKMQVIVGDGTVKLADIDPQARIVIAVNDHGQTIVKDNVGWVDLVA